MSHSHQRLSTESKALGLPLFCMSAPSCVCLQDMAQEDKERVNLEIAAMDPDMKAAIAQAAADAKAAKQQKKTDKADTVRVCRSAALCRCSVSIRRSCAPTCLCSLRRRHVFMVGAVPHHIS
jgi:hypothetical protein